MKYKVTFPNGQVNHYETDTPVGEMANRFPGSLVEAVGAPVEEAAAVEAEPVPTKKRTKKAV